MPQRPKAVRAPAPKKAAAGAAPKLGALLSTLRQGDLVSIGAVSIVGHGPSELRDAAAAELDGPAAAGADELWSVTVDSEVGWYVIVSQDCDIVRDPADEPCLHVCPVSYVSDERWQQLRHGPYSPREFPLPVDKLGEGPDGTKPVADIRFVTSMDKTAVADENVKALRPLSASQQDNFQAWVARRYARAPFPDAVDSDVLQPAAAILEGLLSSARAAKEDDRTPNASGRFMLAADEWRVGGSEKLVTLAVITSEATMTESAGLTDDDREDIIEAGRAWIEKRLRTKLPPGMGYGLTLEIWTLDAMPAIRYRDLAPWTFEKPGDPLEAD